MIETTITVDSDTVPGTETKQEEAKRLREWLGRKAAYYCRPHGFRIIVFLNGTGGCRKCVDCLVDTCQKRAAERLKNKA